MIECFIYIKPDILTQAHQHNCVATVGGFCVQKPNCWKFHMCTCYHEQYKKVFWEKFSFWKKWHMFIIQWNALNIYKDFKRVCTTITDPIILQYIGCSTGILLFWWHIALILCIKYHIREGMMIKLRFFFFQLRADVVPKTAGNYQYYILNAFNGMIVLTY